MKNQVIVLLIVSMLLAGCANFTGKATADVCDDLCQQEKDEYINAMNSFTMDAQGILAKVDDWKTITKKDLDDMNMLKENVASLDVPKDFDLVHDYYKKAFDHYIEAVDYAVKANQEYMLSSDPSNVQSYNMAMSKVINNLEEANRILIYADEELKFATRLASKI